MNSIFVIVWVAHATAKTYTFHYNSKNKSFQRNHLHVSEIHSGELRYMTKTLNNIILKTNVRNLVKSVRCVSCVLENLSTVACT